MQLHHAFFLFVFASGMAAGQMLFKLVGIRYSTTFSQQGFFPGLLAMAGDSLFWFACVLYCALTFFWIWLLSFLPLSKAYPATFFSLIIVSACGFYFLNEPVSLRLLAGLVFMCLGIVLVATG